MTNQMQFLQDKCRLLEKSLRAAAAKCSLRLVNLCELECQARAFCDTDGLIAVSRERLLKGDEEFCRACGAPIDKAGPFAIVLGKYYFLTCGPQPRTQNPEPRTGASRP